MSTPKEQIEARRTLRQQSRAVRGSQSAPLPAVPGPEPKPDEIEQSRKQFSFDSED